MMVKKVGKGCGDFHDSNSKPPSPYSEDNSAPGGGGSGNGANGSGSGSGDGSNLDNFDPLLFSDPANGVFRGMIWFVELVN
jgi:hypothetical protein